MSEVVAVRRIRADEWPLLREMRLGALADAPGAFNSLVEQEAALEESIWRERARRGALAPDAATFVAGEAAAAGTVNAALDKGDQTLCNLTALWVAPQARNRGVGGALMGTVEEWARGRGCRVVSLWVVEANTTAIGLYRRRGYAETGYREPMRRDESIVLAELRKSLAAS